MNPSKQYSSSIAKAALVLSILSAGAATTLAQDIPFPGAPNYSLVVEENLTIDGSLHIHGAAFVGTDVTSNVDHVEVAMDLDQSNGTHVLHVGNNIKGNGSTQVNIRGNDYWFGGSITDANLGINPSDYGDKRDLFGASAPSVFSSIKSFSSTASGFGDSGVSLTKDLSNEKEFTVTQGVSNILNLDSSWNTYLNSNGKISFKGVDADTTLIVNYTPGETSFNFNAQHGDLPNAGNVIWNFVGSGTLTMGLGGTFEGGLIAPEFDVNWNTGNDIDGMIAAKSLNWDGGQNHLFDHSMVFSVVPETTTVLTLCFGAFGALYMRRRASKRA